ncbi:LLM class flavin-dependent oxidoreductase [Agrobacterium rhizogenes]|uniref:LLM class flavin-dependent oxidoreductase n=1 Tax=Rhizobium rhizogenes TaxID=359 RepID=UPI0015716736|nr:LLM class flavin-dependent oxidoreductase [Rhizobium rhizogenes]NTF52930.1 LLM class flavin-dependent oxidoreductase [Rhizobium rhizogenes]NTH10140.1 LLM class flavin-dependent oxidoreductase [Rhizobium rhizogenes]NTH42692.1 LLM class flavin-dependent oxidoreductase [Rhizobium rhizogenes]NTI06699.1 LLM class flavin-dependent oxidoreductase [Rhizobium rhizogenes]NTI13504.1 LLM class flavin-dependent oxidoreductase [Rhizobium rhizogenes]
MAYPNGLQVGIGFDVTAHTADRGNIQRDFWKALIERIDDHVEFVTLEDGFAGADGDGLDAILLANWLAPRSRNIGIIGGAPVSFLEPFHISTAIATLDFVSEGRAGLLVQQYSGARATEAKLAIGALDGFPDTDTAALEQDRRDAIEVIQRLWDSWEDGTVIRDEESHRFLDGSKLHYIDFKGAGFRILGPSITPRPPQGNPIIAALYGKVDDLSIASTANVVFLGLDAGDIPDAIETIRGSTSLEAQAFIADIHIDAEMKSVAETIARIEGIAASGVRGIRLLLGDPARQVEHVVTALLPALKAASLIRDIAGGTLRSRFGLPVAGNRYTAAA